MRTDINASIGISTENRSRQKLTPRKLMQLILTLLTVVFFETAAMAGSGEWNDFERQAAVLKAMNSKSGNLQCKSNCRHVVFDVRSVTFTTHEKKLIAVSSASPDGNCHACAPELSYFFYRVEEGNWNLISSHVGFHHFGSWGEYHQELMRYEKVSDENAAVFLNFAYTGQGYTEESTTALLPKNGQLRNVLNTCSGSSNEGAIVDPQSEEVISWSGAVRVGNTAGADGLYDLIFDIEDDTSGNISTAKFLFDGSKYAYASGDKRMKDCEYSD